MFYTVSRRQEPRKSFPKNPCRLMALDMGERGRGGTSHCCFLYRGEEPSSHRKLSVNASGTAACCRAETGSPEKWRLCCSCWCRPRLSPLSPLAILLSWLFNLLWLDPASETNHSKSSPSQCRPSQPSDTLSLKVKSYYTGYLYEMTGRGLTITC